jgi:predicted GIY-YIG superfamily endonuclease
MKQWCVYILFCIDGSLYTGVTNNLERRIKNHNNGTAECKYTSSRGPVVLVWHGKVDDHSAALKLEARIKKLSRKHKNLIVNSSMSPDDVWLRLGGRN